MPYIKNQLKIDLKVSAKTISLLEQERIREELCDTEYGKYF